MNEPNSFSDRSNARRGANRMIDNGTAPSIRFGLRTLDNGRFEIVWKCGESTEVAHEEEETQESQYSENDEVSEPRALTIAEFVETPEAQANKATWDQMLEKAEAEGWPNTDSDADEEDEDENDASVAAEVLVDIDEHPEHLVSGDDPWPSGMPVKIRTSRNRKLTGTIVDRVDPEHWRVQLDFAAVGATSVYEGADFEAAGAAYKPWAGQPTKPQRVPSATPARPKSIELDRASSKGVMPEKPVITSKANPCYQRRFDYLAECVAKGDWDAVRNYEVKGINSYAKMVKLYRDRLVAAHEANN